MAIDIGSTVENENWILTEARRAEELKIHAQILEQISVKITRNKQIFPIFSSRGRHGIRIPTNNRRTRGGGER